MSAQAGLTEERAPHDVKGRAFVSAWSSRDSALLRCDGAPVKRLDGESAIPGKHVAVDVCDGVTAGAIGLPCRPLQINTGINSGLLRCDGALVKTRVLRVPLAVPHSFCRPSTLASPGDLFLLVNPC